MSAEITPPLASVPFWKVSYLRLWQQCWAYAWGQRHYIIIYHVMFVFTVAFELATPYLFGELVNALQNANDDLLKDCVRLLGLIMACRLGMWVMHGPARVMERRTGQHVYINYTDSMFKKLTELPLSWHQDHHSGSTINRIRTAALALKNFTEMGFLSFQKVMTLLGSLGILIWFNWVIGLASLISFLLSMTLIIALNKKMTAAIHDSNEVGHIASATFFDFVSNIVSIVILRLQAFSQKTLLSKLNLSMSPFMREVKINEWRYFIYSMLNVTMLSAILLGYIWFQLDAGLAVAAGTLVTVYMYQERVGNQGFDFMALHSNWLGALANLRATQNIMEDHARLTNPDIPVPPPGWKNLQIRHLDFAYKNKINDRMSTLSDIALDIRRGEKIALIGTSGAGKSTLLSLLRALHEPAQAEAGFDGESYPFASLAQITTLIPQDPEIFENSIRFNVSFGLDVPDTDIFRALSLAEFLPVLKQLTHGLDTDIREKGVNLSVGQKQRLALARGIFAAERSDIILLDEPTSSIDLPTEERIFNNIFAHFQGKSIIATLHRLHLLPQFDRIVFLDAGRVTADLPAAEALAIPGPIRDLYKTYQQKEA